MSEERKTVVQQQLLKLSKILDHRAEMFVRYVEEVANLPVEDRIDMAAVHTVCGMLSSLGAHIKDVAGMIAALTERVDVVRDDLRKENEQAQRELMKLILMLMTTEGGKPS